VRADKGTLSFVKEPGLWRGAGAEGMEVRLGCYEKNTAKSDETKEGQILKKSTETELQMFE
jgi:hypothetical protein